MPRYYFHLEDGQRLLGDSGLDLLDIAVTLSPDDPLAKALRRVPGQK